MLHVAGDIKKLGTLVLQLQVEIRELKAQFGVSEPGIAEVTFKSCEEIAKYKPTTKERKELVSQQIQ